MSTLFPPIRLLISQRGKLPAKKPNKGSPDQAKLDEPPGDAWISA